MLKVLGFVRRHERLSHDEYRAAHAGYHNSYGRRLNGIRGYLLNVRANRDPEELFGATAEELLAGAPADFDDLWSGYGQLMFDSRESYLGAKTPVRDKPGPTGLEWDDVVAAVGGDAPHLYCGLPFQFHVAESVVIPVRRPEHKVVKLVQFGKRRLDVPVAAFQSYWSGAYAALSRQVPGLLGHIVNFPTELDVKTGFFSEESGAFTREAEDGHHAFMAQFDGIAEFWFASIDAFVDWRTQEGEALRSLENDLFEGFFFREVDETVAVLPDRLPPAPFYHR
ncbi:MAG: hypothetical protein ACJA09_001194 [Alcanivorax sp.]|jgi:hypothetical protein